MSVLGWGLLGQGFLGQGLLGQIFWGQGCSEAHMCALYLTAETHLKELGSDQAHLAPGSFSACFLFGQKTKLFGNT